MGQISYHLYQLILKFLLNQEIPSENELLNLKIAQPADFKILVRDNDSSTLNSKTDSDNGSESERTKETIKENSGKYKIDCGSGKIGCARVSEDDNKTACDTTTSAANVDANDGIKSQSPIVNMHGDLDPTTSYNSSGETWLGQMQFKFCQLASGMFTQTNGPVVSLMSKRSRKEIVPIEGAGALIVQIHTLNGQPGNFHTTPTTTISIYRSRYTFGEEDFGITGDSVNRMIMKCSDEKCVMKNLSYAANSFTQEDSAGLWSSDHFYEGAHANHLTIFCNQIE